MLGLAVHAHVAVVRFIMAKGAFIVAPDPGNPKDILFKVASEDVKEIPEDQLLLRDEVDRALTVLRTAFRDDEKRFAHYYRQLLSLAQTGLVGNAAQPEFARRALLVLKGDIVASEGSAIKNRYMKVLGSRALTLAVPGVMWSLITDLFSADKMVIGYFGLLWAGCMSGVWLSFGARKTVIEFEHLHIMEEDMLEPYVRLAFAGLLTIIVGLLFSTKAVTVTMGSLTSADIVSRPDVAILIGMLCGFSEKALSTKVASQAAAILSFGK